MPNQKKIIISTQPTEQISKLEIHLADNYRVIGLPMIGIENLPLNEPLKETLLNINRYNWLIFTSMRGVRGFFNLLAQIGIHVEKTNFPKISCIGSATDSELNVYGIHSDYINPGKTSHEFSAHLILETIKPSDNVLLVLGERADNHLQVELQKYCTVSRINVYKTIDIEYIDLDIFNLIEKDQYDLLVFTSPSAFENFIRLGGYNPDNHQFKIVSIGNRTTSVIENLGFSVLLTSKKSNIDGLAEEIMNYFEKTEKIEV